LAKKNQSKEELASKFPIVLSLDISRFYGSIYTHALPWAALGKSNAKALFRARRLGTEWSDEIDILARNCNSQQTVGLPIGPDTSRILSELVLSRIDSELCAPKSGFSSKQIFHNIDDYQFGIFSHYEAERAKALFSNTIREFELQINDFKTQTNEGLAFHPLVLERQFDDLVSVRGKPLIERLFERIYELTKKSPNSNIIGFALRRFRTSLLDANNDVILLQHLQRLMYAVPHLFRWIAPIYLHLLAKLEVAAGSKQAIDWGIEGAVRRGDLGSISWFLYAKLFLRQTLSRQLSEALFGLNSPIVDVQLFHLRSKGLAKLLTPALRERYDRASLSEAGWLVLYEVERNGWDLTATFRRLSEQSDHARCLNSLRIANCAFYDTADRALTIEVFDGWERPPENVWGLALEAFRRNRGNLSDYDN
jgi:hypothetical protein